MRQGGDAVSPVMDALLDDTVTVWTWRGLRLKCGRGCGHRVRLGWRAPLGAQLREGRHDCPLADEVLDHVLTVRAAQRTGGGRRG